MQDQQGRRRARRASALAAVALGLSGCAHTVGTTPPPPPTAGSDVTGARAADVELMLDNARSSGPLTQSTLVAVITKYGGGYVTSLSATGTPGAADEKLQIDTVLGPGSVQATVQGESDTGASAMRCYRFTAGYLTPAAGVRQIPCPAHLTASQAAKLASRQATVEATAARYGLRSSATTLPRTLAQAEGLLIPAHDTKPTAASSFAASPNLATLAVPQPTGGCIYVRLAEPGTRSQPVSVSAWAAPVDAPCTAATALLTAGYLTYDVHAGG
jgi:hypothetical protein